MPDETIVSAPAAASAPALPNAPKVEISAARIGEGATPAEPPKPGSARDRMNQDLRKRAGQEPGTERTPEKILEKTNETPKAAKPATEVEETKEVQSSDEPGKVADAKLDPAADPKKAKVSPWKLVEEYKQKLAKAESERLEIEKRAIPEAKWKEKEAELESKARRLSELEEEMRYVNYSKTDEFKTKYQDPYEKSWATAMEELGEIKIEVGENGETRPMNAGDLLRLVNLPVDEAQAAAEEMFGGLASEVMAYRKDIKKLWNAQADALENARKTGAEREKTTMEQRQKQFGEVSGEIRKVYASANEEIKADPKYGKFFTPVEGDENVNQRLAKGFALADRAFSENPMNAKTPEERASIVRRHAAVRNRCAAFGRLVYEGGVKDARIAELEKKLGDFKASEPVIKGSSDRSASEPKTSAMESAFAELRKRAKPVR